MLGNVVRMGFVVNVNAEVFRSLMVSYDIQQEPDMDVRISRSFVRMTNCGGCVRIHYVDRNHTSFLTPES